MDSQFATWSVIFHENAKLNRPDYICICVIKAKFKNKLNLW